MVKFKALYKGMNDDLKDAEMMIDYACEISKHEEDKALADEIAKYAQYRLEHFMNFHKLFETEASKEKTVDKETVSECMWHETHEMFQHWYNDIERKNKEIFLTIREEGFIALLSFIPNLRLQLFYNKFHLYIFRFRQHLLHLQ